MTRDTLDRRTVLQTMAVGAASVALAGCSSSNGSGGDTTTDDRSTDDSGGGARNFGGWFDDVSNYDGVVDETGSSEVTVDVGAKGNNGNFAFGPAAVKVDVGTTVVWEWTGKGTTHNVVAEDGSFESKMTNSEGHTFEHAFESAGTYKYACTPHKTMGMKGAVVVE